MTLQRNFYEILGVSPKATTDEIKRKYREMARKFHPDRPNVTDKAAGQKVFAQINRAYGVLSDPEKRAKYDATLDPTNAAAHTAATNGAPPASTGPLTAAQSANVNRLVGDAETALLQNKLDNALSICQLVLKTDPRNTKALGFLGETFERMGKPTEAAAAYRHALQIAPSALLQAKLNRLQGAGGAPGASRPSAPPLSNELNGRPPTPPPSSNGTGRPSQTAPTNGTGGSGVAKPRPAPQKPAGGLFSRLLGKK